MLATAKVFSTGNSQAVRLPKAFRMNVAEVWISRNEATGEITLKPKDDDAHAKGVNELMAVLRSGLFDGDEHWLRDPNAPVELQRDLPGQEAD